MILLTEYCKGTCKEEHVQRYINCVWNYCIELLAIGFQRLLGIRIRSSTIHFILTRDSRMDNSNGKYICCDSNIRMLSGTLFFLLIAGCSAEAVYAESMLF